MSGSALVVMVSICTLIWGGFLALLTRAVRQESGKAEEHPPHPSP
jgi:hypothetical protein